MSKPLGDYTGKCGNCRNFAFLEYKRIHLWGTCLSPQRSNYHQASQKACKLYVPYEVNTNDTNE